MQVWLVVETIIRVILLLIDRLDRTSWSSPDPSPTIWIFGQNKDRGKQEHDSGLIYHKSIEINQKEMNGRDDEMDARRR